MIYSAMILRYSVVSAVLELATGIAQYSGGQTKPLCAATQSAVEVTRQWTAPSVETLSEKVPFVHCRSYVAQSDTPHQSPRKIHSCCNLGKRPRVSLALFEVGRTSTDVHQYVQVFRLLPQKE